MRRLILAALLALGFANGAVAQTVTPGIITTSVDPSTLGLSNSMLLSGLSTGSYIGSFTGAKAASLVNDGGGLVALSATGDLVVGSTSPTFASNPSFTIQVMQGGVLKQYQIQTQQPYATTMAAVSSLQAYYPMQEAVSRTASTVADTKRGGTGNANIYLPDAAITAGRRGLVKGQQGRTSFLFNGPSIGQVYFGTGTPSTGIKKDGTAAFGFHVNLLPTILRKGAPRDYVLFGDLDTTAGAVSGAQNIGIQISLYWDGSRLLFRFLGQGSATDYLELRSTSEVPAGPVNIDFSYGGNRAGTGSTLYINGTAYPLTIVTGASTLTWSAGSQFCVGISGGTGKLSAYSGFMSDVAIFNAALTAAQVATIAQPLALTPRQTRPGASTPTIIVDTDEGDGSDIGSIALTLGFANRGEVIPIAVGSATRAPAATAALQAYMQQSGYGSVPIGAYVGELSTIATTPGGSASVANMAGIAKGRYDYEDVVRVYRRALAAQPDKTATSYGGVRIAAIGGVTNIVNLLKSPADDISPQTGAQLIAAKVERIYQMAGYYPTQTGTSEYNINRDPTAASYLIANTPVPMVWAGYDLGVGSGTGASGATSSGQTSAFGNYDIHYLRRGFIDYGGYFAGFTSGWDVYTVFAAVRGVTSPLNYQVQNATLSLTGSYLTWGDGTTPGLHSALGVVTGQFNAYLTAIDDVSADAVTGPVQ